MRVSPLRPHVPPPPPTPPPRAAARLGFGGGPGVLNIEAHVEPWKGHDR